ncbi:MAG TPA: PAS domain S-box protein [Sphingomicrobium sp.]|nr:PAS domain S-box protein [Sphingomicrobium sp.]
MEGALENVENVTSDPFKLLVQSIVDYAIYMLDPNGFVTSWNSGAERIKGYQTEEIVGKHFSTFYTEEDKKAGLPKKVLETARDEGKYEGEGWRVRKDGTRFWAGVVVDRINDETGKLVGFAKITRDLTEQKEAQHALLQSEQRFRILVQGVTDYAIFMLDPEGRVTNWNAGAQRIKGYKPEEIIGEHFSRFYTPEDFDSGVPRRAIETALETGRYEAEGWRVRKDGSRFWASVVLDAIRDEDGELIGFAKITRDMSQKREAQLRLDESREQLFRSQKMEALGQLTGGLAHDFNNLLTAILGACELGLRNLKNPDKVRKMLEGVRGSAQRGASLTKQLLAFARAQPLEIRQIDLKQFFGDVTTLVRPSLRSNIEVVTEISDQLWPIDADAGALELALLNLAFNARDAMNTGGTLKISAHNEVLSGQPDGLKGEHVVLRVSDTGSGMQREVMDRVFEPFFTTKSFGEGTGLGLSQVFGFAKQIGGAVSVNSELDEGATFTLYLPASKGADTSQWMNGEKALGRVLIVEDDMFVAELAADMLGELGFESTITHSAKEALERVAGGDRPKLVFTDVVMPGGISGIELARKLRERFPELPILVTTGYSEQVSGTQGFPVLQKPYELGALARAIGKLLKLEIAVH